MFNTLASYLLGNTNSNQDKEDNPIESTSNNNNNNNNNNINDSNNNNLNINLTTTVCDEDDDWLLVVKRDKKDNDDDDDENDSLPRTDSEEELPFVDIKNSPVITRNQHHLHNRHHNRNINDDIRNVGTTSTSCPTPSSMDESWFVTPPPCFTSTGPVNMETSPLENLLIEHPSMSVYRFMRNSPQLIEDDDIVVLDFGIEDLEPHPAEERTPINTGRGVANQSQRSARHRSDRVEQLSEEETKQCMLLRNAQKSHERKTRQSLCRSAIERSNKVREINSKGGRQKRSDMYNSRIISRANNNRKC